MAKCRMNVAYILEKMDKIEAAIDGRWPGDCVDEITTIEALLFKAAAYEQLVIEAVDTITPDDSPRLVALRQRMRQALA
jgi:hypothetical protein